MLEGRGDELKGDTARRALASLVLSSAGLNWATAQYPGCLKQLPTHLFSAAPVPENSSNELIIIIN